jgi:two-component system sensor histidine kinase/response regulator
MEPKGKILVIDDEIGIRRGCRRALEPEGFVIEEASTLNEGLSKIREDFDLILLDVMMPDGRGIDLLEPIFGKDPDTVCIIITGFATVELAISAIKQGAYDFISKPFSSDLLLMTVNQGLEKRRLSLESKRLVALEKEAAALAHAKDEMEKLDQAKSAFMLTIAHELRSPVGGAQSLLRTMTRGIAGDLSDQQRDILKRIEARLDQLMVLINDLLSLASSKSSEIEKPLEAFELKPILQEVVDRFSVEAENKEISLHLEMSDEALLVEATYDGLERIFSNLIGNAIKYTPEKGIVQAHVRQVSDNVEIKISDNGMGIPEGDLLHIWDEFFRAKNARHSGISGTGLGLSIVKQYVERFKGHIEVESSVGRGSCFTVILPLQLFTSVESHE